jgi:hypothetical protein
LPAVSGLWYSPSIVLNSFQTSGNSPGAARCRAGIPGFGTVGSALARRLTGPDSLPPLELTPICDRRAREKCTRQAQALARLRRTDRVEDLITGDVHVVVEAVAPAVALSGDPMAIARHRAATVPAPVPTAPATIKGLTHQRFAEAV